jgi:hypothetical protein
MKAPVQHRVSPAFYVILITLGFTVGCKKEQDSPTQLSQAPGSPKLTNKQITRGAVDQAFREGRFYADEDKAFHFAFGKEKGAQAIKEFGGNPSQKSALDHTQHQTSIC